MAFAVYLPIPDTFPFEQCRIAKNPDDRSVSSMMQNAMRTDDNAKVLTLGGCSRMKDDARVVVAESRPDLVNLLEIRNLDLLPHRLGDQFRRVKAAAPKQFATTPGQKIIMSSPLVRDELTIALWGSVSQRSKLVRHLSPDPPDRTPALKWPPVVSDSVNGLARPSCYGM